MKGGEVLRTLVTVDSEPVVVFHKDHAIMEPHFDTAEAWQALLQGSHGSPVFEADQGDWIWNRVSPYCFNCHTLSIGSFLGLGPHDWLEGSASLMTLMENPVRVLLDRFFDQIVEVEGWDIDLEAHGVMEDDVVVMCNHADGDIVHSGRVKWIDGQPFIVSKLGEHPIIISTFSVLRNEYFGQFNTIQIYRLRPAARQSQLTRSAAIA